MKTEDMNFIMMPIPAHMFTAVCALLGGASTIAIAGPALRAGDPVIAEARKIVEPQPQPEPEKPAAEQPAGEEEAQHDPNEIDTGGWPWSVALHASTRGKTKDGYWRMKVGVARPDPKPGFPVAAASAPSTGATGTAANGSGAAAGAAATAPAAGPATAEEDDEFAAFRAAAAKTEATDTAAAAAVPARKWTDADLGSLCNQAAMKLGDPEPIKDIIATFVPAGEVAHSRMIPEDKREDFAKAVEAKAGITFAG